MKTTYKLLILLDILLLFAHVTRAQDTTRTPIGYTIDYPHLYILVDTIHNMSQVHNYYHCKMFFSVNGGKAIELRRDQVMTVWNTKFTLIVCSKHYKQTYQF